MRRDCRAELAFVAGNMIAAVADTRRFDPGNGAAHKSSGWTSRLEFNIFYIISNLDDQFYCRL